MKLKQKIKISFQIDESYRMFNFVESNFDFRKGGLKLLFLFWLFVKHTKISMFDKVPFCLL